MLAQIAPLPLSSKQEKPQPKGEKQRKAGSQQNCAAKLSSCYTRRNAKLSAPPNDGKQGEGSEARYLLPHQRHQQKKNINSKNIALFLEKK